MCLSTETRKAIRAWMEQEKIRQVDLAATLGMTKGQLSNILNGHGSVSMKQADRIVDALGCWLRVTLEERG